MKIRQHPRMRGISIGDDVYCYPQQLFARVEEVFPAAVCVKIGILSIRHQMELLLSPQLWRADDIENLSVCRYCGSRENLSHETGTGIPFRICCHCLDEPMSGCHRQVGGEDQSAPGSQALAAHDPLAPDSPSTSPQLDATHPTALTRDERDEHEEDGRSQA